MAQGPERYWALEGFEFTAMLHRKDMGRRSRRIKAIERRREEEGTLARFLSPLVVVGLVILLVKMS